MKYLGMDLGTANTYIYALNPGGNPAPLIIPGVSDDKGSISTVLLYELGVPVLAGNIAEGEYYSQPGLQKNRELASQFKPEIGLGDTFALKAATDFLRLVREALPKGAIERDSVLTIGTPALAREDYRINLRKCLLDAGWPAPVFCRESDAALVSCLQAGVLHMDDIGRKCLIFDFGGGTCDYTSVESLDILQGGGDILYGGRLFDDLFYQAFCRSDPEFARAAPVSPYAWHAHWLECRAVKEQFSDFMGKGGQAGALTLRIVWHDVSGASHESFLRDYDRDQFLRDAENYSASPELLRLLAPYSSRGGLGDFDRDLLQGRNVGLVSWLRHILESVDRRSEVARVVLTGGSSRWFFVQDLASEIFPRAGIVSSARGFEDIAFGLALFPVLEQSREKAQTLLDSRLGQFTTDAIKRTARILEANARKVAIMCSERIVERDVMPALEAASKKSMTVADLEADFAENIRSDKVLLEIVKKNSEALRNEIQNELNFSFRSWLRQNGVPLAPTLDFPAAMIGEDFFNRISVKISRLDSLNLMNFTLKNILPLLVGTATAGVLAHSGEPVSTVVGGGAAFGATWLLARTAPAFLEKRKLPTFILNERNRKKIAEKNRVHIENALLESFAEIRDQLELEIQRRFRESLGATLAGLTALNQVKTA